MPKPELRNFSADNDIDPALVTTLPTLLGYDIVQIHGLVAEIGTASGKAAKGKATDAFREAWRSVRQSAAGMGANAIVGLQITNFSASQGGMLGDAIGCTLMGTAVTVQPHA